MQREHVADARTKDAVEYKQLALGEPVFDKLRDESCDHQGFDPCSLLAGAELDAAPEEFRRELLFGHTHPESGDVQRTCAPPQSMRG